MPGLLRGLPGPGGVWFRGVPGPGGLLRGVPGGDTPRMATAAGGTHPTGMHFLHNHIQIQMNYVNVRFTKVLLIFL